MIHSFSTCDPIQHHKYQVSLLILKYIALQTLTIKEKKIEMILVPYVYGKDRLRTKYCVITINQPNY